MLELKIIGWLLWLALATLIVFEFVGMRKLVQMFPEGYSWWMPYANFGSLAFFGVASICNPWNW